MASTTEQGYGAQHKRLRAQWQVRLDAGEVINCWRCTERIWADDPWDLGHDDNDRSKYKGPEHSNQCNRAAGGRRGAAVMHANRTATHREW